MRVYLAFTPYHLILAAALQVGGGDPESHLIYADEAGICRAIPNFIDPVGASSLTLLAPTDRRANWRDLYVHRLNTVRTRRAIAKYLSAGDHLYVFNSTRAEAQRLKGRLPPDAHFAFVEDGLDAYLPVNLERVPIWLRIVHRIVWARTFPGVVDQTTFLPFSEYHLLVPEMSRIVRGQSKVMRIESTWLDQAVRRFSGLVPEPLDPGAVTDLYVLGHSSRAKDVQATLARVDLWARRVRQQYGDVIPAVKAHPREQNGDLLSGLSSTGLKVLPHAIPGELLTPWLRADCRITGGLSTFILTSKLLLPDRTINLVGGIAPEFVQQLQRWDPTMQQQPA